MGGVATGSIKAQLAASTNGNVKLITSILLFNANILKIGNRRKVVAVLLVNSVKKEVIMAIINIRVNNLNELKE